MSRLDTRTVRYLNHLPGIVVRATPNRITWDERFKHDVANRLRLGDSPAKLFRQAGVGSEVIGYKRIERCCARWKNAGDDPLDDVAMLLTEAGADDTHIDRRTGTITFHYDGRRYRVDPIPPIDRDAHETGKGGNDA